VQQSWSDNKLPATQAEAQPIPGLEEAAAEVPPQCMAFFGLRLHLHAAMSMIWCGAQSHYAVPSYSSAQNLVPKPIQRTREKWRVTSYHFAGFWNHRFY
jgi:hypothetical protein